MYLHSLISNKHHLFPFRNGAARYHDLSNPTSPNTSAQNYQISHLGKNLPVTWPFPQTKLTRITPDHTSRRCQLFLSRPYLISDRARCNNRPSKKTNKFRCVSPCPSVVCFWTGFCAGVYRVGATTRTEERYVWLAFGPKVLRLSLLPDRAGVVAAVVVPSSASSGSRTYLGMPTKLESQTNSLANQKSICLQIVAEAVLPRRRHRF